MSRLVLPGLAGLLLLASADCAPRSVADDPPADVAARAEIAATMERYMVAARRVDADAIAGFYSPTAVLFEPGIHPIETRDSIRAFMSAFPGVRVDSAAAIADTIEVFGSTAFLWGSYHERLAFPGQPESVQDGRFVIEWVKVDSTWLIQRYFRLPLPAPPPAPGD